MIDSWRLVSVVFSLRLPLLPSLQSCQVLLRWWIHNSDPVPLWRRGRILSQGQRSTREGCSWRVHPWAQQHDPQHNRTLPQWVLLHRWIHVPVPRWAVRLC